MSITNTLRPLLATLLITLSFSVSTATENEPAPESDLAESRLVRILTGRNELNRLKSIEQLKSNSFARDRAINELIFALSKHSEQARDGRPLARSTAELVGLIATSDAPDAEQTLIRLLDCPHLHVSMLCADALGRNQCIDAIEPLKQQVDRSEWKTHYGFRFNLIRSLTLMDHPDAYEFLNLIRRRIDGQLLHELNQIADRVTLDDFRSDQARYDAFKEAIIRPTSHKQEQRESSDSMFKQASYSESADRINFKRQKYYGIDIDAKRLLFIIDHSGSMKAGATSNGQWGTRLLHAKRALNKAIEELPADHEFGIIFYSEKVRKWKSELVYATDENKRNAAVFIHRLGYGGSTNTHGALRESMEFDDDLEAVFLLTDGIPSSGRLVQPAAIINDIVHRNRLRHLKINTIGIAVNSKTQLFLKTLAQKCSGQFTLPQ